MKTIWRETRLTMVESKSRKASFLRDAIREVPLSHTSVVEARFEKTAGIAATADLVTVRAVKADSVLYIAAYSALKAGGRFAMFCSAVKPSFDSMMSFEEATGCDFNEGRNPAFAGPEEYELPGQSSLLIWRKRNL